MVATLMVHGTAIWTQRFQQQLVKIHQTSIYGQMHTDMALSDEMFNLFQMQSVLWGK